MLLSLACGATAESAARECGISPRTVYHRQADPTFRRRWLALRGEMAQWLAGTLTATGSEAVRTLLELKPGLAPNTRLGAARVVLESGARLRELTELQERIAALEQRHADGQGH